MARTAEPPLTVIVDPDDDLGCLEELRRLHARSYGQILCEPDPTATSADLARYLLEALGKQARASRAGSCGRWSTTISELSASANSWSPAPTP